MTTPNEKPETVRQRRERRRLEREARWAVQTEATKRQDDCASQRHRWGRDSLIFKGQRQCVCGAVEGENPN
jgi:hypothetical protein